MYVVINHKNGKQYRIPVHQVVVHSDDGHPIAVTYEHAGMIIHTDRSKKDFDRTTHMLKVKKLKIEEPVENG